MFKTIPEKYDVEEEAETLLLRRLHLLGLSDHAVLYHDDIDSHEELDHRDDLRRLHQFHHQPQARTLGSSSYDYHCLFSEGDSIRPEMVYVQSKPEANDNLSRLSGPVLGFDVEYVLGDSFHQQPALLQFCDDRLIVLVHLQDTEWDFEPIPSKAVEMLCNPSIYKTGANIYEDLLCLMRSYPEQFYRTIPTYSPNSQLHHSDATLNATIDVQRVSSSTSDNDILGVPNKILELSLLARAVYPSSWNDHGGTQIALATLCKTYLGKNLRKGHKSDWRCTLIERQKEYAANDAYASLQICLELQSLAREKGISLNLDRSCTEFNLFDIPRQVKVRRSTDKHPISNLTSYSPVQGQI
ncbi:hypothetical protein I203_108477 [Kwoniella mangroviensis CBS 8507]|uniref:hypothetical protein n=1 Tax=Kwoniella mangroviensis CBS 8507 TaxID=1296122 RepID=UPI00080CF05D|nr:uncharacterized protein I203_05373 [Kwoniella mangroviensis CBS 8507]OCF65692.1 hypothetical protein I203_05373 [Kwoniella mangroviensis CBS 8507]